MAKPLTIVGRTAILAAIYDPDHLPSAIIAVGSSNPFCLHSLREEDLSFFDETFMPQVRGSNEVDPGDDKKDEELKVKLYKFFEDYPQQDHTCMGCYHSEKLERHKIMHSEEACTKTTEDCA
jgi:hypothetical protein